MRARRTDANQLDLVAALRHFGASVVVTSHVGAGFPDLIVGWQGVTYLIEVKDGEKGAAAKLTPAQKWFMESWTGMPVFVAHSTAEGVAFVCGFVPEGEPWKKGGARVSSEAS